MIYVYAEPKPLFIDDHHLSPEDFEIQGALQQDGATC